jgi:hypothetical protein
LNRNAASCSTRKFSCNPCDLQFNSAKDLHKHVLKHRNSLDKFDRNIILSTTLGHILIIINSQPNEMDNKDDCKYCDKNKNNYFATCIHKNTNFKFQYTTLTLCLDQ